MHGTAQEADAAELNFLGLTHIHFACTSWPLLVMHLNIYTMKKIILIFALLSTLFSYSSGLTEKIGRAGFFRFSITEDEEFPDDGDGPPVENPPLVPINGNVPYLMAVGVLIAAGYYALGRNVRKPD